MPVVRPVYVSSPRPEGAPSLFAIPGTERRERHYRIETDRFDDDCLTVLVAVIRREPFSTLTQPVVAPQKMAGGFWFGLFRVPADTLLCPL